MPLIPKPNYNQIFASQAPAQDKPAVFNNYPEGWGVESRPNNGKPTIKGFNYLQQTSDLKDLWILQNGAALPYDAAMEYAEGAVVVKDGVLQQWKGGVWVKVAAWSSIEGKPELYTKTEADTLFIEASQIGQPNGVAGLGALGKLDSSQFPKATETALGVVKLVNSLNSTDTTQAATPAQVKILADRDIGVNQSWGSYTSSRSANTFYTNSTGRPITVNITLNNRNDNSSMTAEVNGVTVGLLSCSTQYGQGKTMSFIVPHGHNYRVTGTFDSWSELR